MKNISSTLKIILSCLFLAQDILSPFPIWGAETATSLLSTGSTPTPLPVMQGLKFYPNEPLKLDFIFSGNHSLGKQELETQSQKSIRYFLTTLTIPDNDFWVNLSPYEHDRIIPENFGETAMGQVMLEQDYLLKQLTASFMSPETETGAAFWEKVYERAYQEFGVTNIPTETFHKIWIIPKTAMIQETSDKALITDSSLNVMLENDYVAKAAAQGDIEPKTLLKESSKEDRLVTDVFRNVVLPEITRYINDDPHFTELHQMYHAMVMAVWFKQKLKNTVLDQSYLSQNKTQGLETDNGAFKEDVYKKYLKLFTDGATGIIKEEYDPETQSIIPRRYFSGGLKLDINPAMMVENKTNFQLSSWIKRLGATALFVVTATLTAWGQTTPAVNQLPGLIQSDQQNIPDSITTPEILAAPLMQALEKAIAETPENPSIAEKKNTRIFKTTLTKLRLGLNGKFNKVRQNGESDILLRIVEYSLKKLNKKDPRTQPVLDASNDLQGFHSYNTFNPNKPTLLFVHGGNRGVYDNFEPFFKEFNNTHNIVFFLYSEAVPLSKLTNIFVTEWKTFLQEHPTDQPLNVIGYSYGNIIVRSAILSDQQNSFQKSRYIAMVPPFAGSRTARFSSRPEAKFMMGLAAGQWRSMTVALDPNGGISRNIFSLESSKTFLDLITEQYVIRVEGDIHNPQSSDKESFQERYKAALGTNVTTLPRDEQHTITGSSHTDMTHYPETMLLMRKFLGIDNASLQKASTPVGGIDFNTKFLDLKTRGTEEMTIFLKNLQNINFKDLKGLDFKVETIKPVNKMSYFFKNKHPHQENL